MTKKMIAIFMSLLMLVMSMAVSATETDRIVSYTEYAMITDVNYLFALAEQDANHAAALSVSEYTRDRYDIEFSNNQVAIDQIAAKTVYTDGRVIEERVNTVATRVASTSSGTSTLAVVSNIYYEYDYSVSAPFTLIKAGTKIVNNGNTLRTATIVQELYVKGTGGTEPYPAESIHYSVGLNSEVYIDSQTEKSYAISDAFFFQHNALITMSDGEYYELLHGYDGYNDYILG